MEENLYKKLKSVGASNLVFGILIILFGIGAGVMMIINAVSYTHLTLPTIA